jgi:hypothetical protein
MLLILGCIVYCHVALSLNKTAVVPALIFVSLVPSKATQSFSNGFWLSMTMDNILSIYIAASLWARRSQTY